jgi:5'-methylthioadenosine phosphorylase
MSVAVILGSAFADPILGGRPLQPVPIATRFGEVVLHRHPDRADAWVLFRHGAPHRWLPNQIPYRAHAAALREVGCGALLVTSSVGVLDGALPLDSPLPIGDLLMPDNRLPDGSACTMFVTPEPEQHHLVLDEGLMSRALTGQVERLARSLGQEPSARCVFAYTPGPRNKTAAENVFWLRVGAQINSMSVGPEVVLANELGIPCAAVGVGHKYSGPGRRDRLEREEMRGSLDVGRTVVEPLAAAFCLQAAPVPFANRFYRYG